MEGDCGTNEVIYVFAQGQVSKVTLKSREWGDPSVRTKPGQVGLERGAAKARRLGPAR